MAQPEEALEDLFDGDDEHYGGDERLGYDRGPASRVPAESVERLIRKAAHTLSAASVGFRGATPRTRYGALDDIILAAGCVRLRRGRTPQHFSYFSCAGRPLWRRRRRRQTSAA
jgi:hypothetical protein